MKIEPGKPSAVAPNGPVRDVRKLPAKEDIGRVGVDRPIQSPAFAPKRFRSNPTEDMPVELAELGSIAGVPLAQIRADLIALEANLPPPDTRIDRAARWVLRGELRKMAVLDQYLTGFIKG